MRSGSPKAQPDARARTAGARQDPILVVEDDPSILAMLSDLLHAEGYAVQAAVNGADALQHVERQRPALVLLDMRMPVMDGWAFAQALRERGIQLPIVVMTAAEDARRWAIEVGARDYLAKPFDLEAFLNTVKRNARAAAN